MPAQRRPCSMTAPATRSTLRKSIISRCEDSYIIVTSQEMVREKGSSLNSAILTLSRLHQTFTCMSSRLIRLSNCRYQ